MFTRVIKRSRSMRVGPGHAGDDVAAHGPAHPPSASDPPMLALHDASWQAVQNAEHTPDQQFPDGRSLYLDRPLPRPPPPKSSAPATFAMPARPSTSSGPSAKASAFLGLGLMTRSSADKRLSKDDMYLGGYKGQRKGLQPYRIGVRGGLPTPESSPDTDKYYPALSPPMTIPPRMHTPDTLSSGEIQIGMALGSPSHPPEALPWESVLPPNMQPLTPPDLYQRAAAPVQRQKTQRRKLFGGLFGSRKKEEPQRANPVLAESNYTSSTTTSMASRPSGQSTPTRSNTVADRKTPRHKPLIIRSNTQPAAESLVYEPRGVTGNASRGQRPAIAQVPKYQSTNYLSPNPPAPSISTPSASPLLDIEIPSIKLERYSVMFSNVLNPQATSSSLLTRRQATLEKLKTINDRILYEEEEKEKLRGRSATSPHPTKSPGFSLFPPTPQNHQGSTQVTPRRLIRSNTSPANLPSPSRPSFDQQPRKERKTVTIISPRSMAHHHQPPHSALSHSSSTQPERIVSTAEAESFQFGPDVSGLILDSPVSQTSSSASNFTSLDALPLRPTIPEPEWTIISSSTAPAAAETARSSASSTTTRRSPSSSSSSVHTHLTRPSVDVDVDVHIDESDATLKAAVEVSIARQISVSHQQRKLLGGQQPGRPRAVKMAAAGSGQAVKKVVAGRVQGRVGEGPKTGTPTEMTGAWRRSARGVVEGV